MKSFENILASVDTRTDVHPALEWAVHVAKQHEGKLKIVDVLSDFAWHIRVAMREHDHVRELLLEEKREKLAALARPLRDEGLDVSTAALSGQSSLQITREVLRDEHDLVVRASKGPSSRRLGFFGSTSMQLLRKCPCPVWIVRPDTRPQFKNILAAIDPAVCDHERISLNSGVIEMARTITEMEQGRLRIIHAWTVIGEQMLRSQMDDREFAEFETRAQAAIEESLAKFRQAHNLSPETTDLQVVKGEPAYAIPQFIETHGVDLLVMGTVGRYGIAGMIMGNTAELILDNVRCAVLALKPRGFVSPIQLQ